jgi:hypothetical protein
MTPLQPCPSQDPAAIDRWSEWQEWLRNAYSWRPVHRDGLEIGNRGTLAETPRYITYHVPPPRSTP